MIHVDRVLFPTDGSDSAERARRHAVHLASQFDAALHVIHVTKEGRSDSGTVREADILGDLHGPGARTGMAQPRVWEQTVTAPSAADGILTYAVEYDAHLVVLGTHGRRGVRRLVLGSVAEEVVRRAPCPVVTVGRGAIEPEAMEEGHMLVPVDFSDYQKRLLAHAREIALAYGMHMTLLHVVEVQGLPDAYGLSADPPEPGVLAEQTERVLQDAVGRLRKKGVDVSVEVRGGHPADEVLAAADALGADFLTIASHGRRGMERVLMGSVAEKVIRRAPCPVCTVKAFGTSLVEDDGAERPRENANSG